MRSQGPECAAWHKRGSGLHFVLSGRPNHLWFFLVLILAQCNDPEILWCAENGRAGWRGRLSHASLWITTAYHSFDVWGGRPQCRVSNGGHCIDARRDKTQSIEIWAKTIQKMNSKQLLYFNWSTYGSYVNIQFSVRVREYFMHEPHTDAFCCCRAFRRSLLEWFWCMRTFFISRM